MKYHVFHENSLCVISATLSGCRRAWPCKDVAAAQPEGGLTSLLPTLVTPKQNPFFCEGTAHLQLCLCSLPDLQPVRDTRRGPAGVSTGTEAVAPRQYPAQQYPAAPLQMCCCKPFTSTAAAGSAWQLQPLP